MAKTPRRSPGVGRGIGDNSNLPSQADIRSALAQEIIDKQKIAEANEKRKENRKAAEGKKIPLDYLDRLFKMKDMTAEEIEQRFKLDMHFAGALHSDLGEQFDIFAPKPDAPERRAAHRHIGFMAGIKGEANTPPPGLTGDALQQWQDGYNEGMSARNDAMAEEAERLAESGQTASLSDLTAAGDKAARRGRKPKAEGDAAAAASEPSTAPEPGQSGSDPAPAPGEGGGDGAPQPGESYSGAAPAGILYALSSEEPMASGRIKVYRDGQPFDTAEAGSAPIYDEHAPAKPTAPPVADDGFEATEEELAQQQGRKKQEADVPDPAEVEAEAKRLAESGFLPGEKTKGRGRK